jgi:hypothetical protein
MFSSMDGRLEQAVGVIPSLSSGQTRRLGQGYTGAELSPAAVGVPAESAVFPVGGGFAMENGAHGDLGVAQGTSGS